MKLINSRKLYCNLEQGKGYNATLPTVHIGILPHSPFSDMTDFYSEYLMINCKNHHIFTRNFSLRMLCLDQLKNVPKEDINYLQKRISGFSAGHGNAMSMIRFPLLDRKGAATWNTNHCQSE